MENWIENATKEDAKQNEVLSFNDYIGLFDSQAKLQCRPTFAYLKDMLNHFGQDEQGHYKVFRLDHIDAPAVYGQYCVEDAVASNLLNFEEEGFNNKFILLVGPNGSAKSSIVKKLMKGAEEYSKTDEGSLYTFSWIFPIDNFTKGTLGLGGGQTQSDLTSFAYLEDKEITAILGSELKDHPLLLIPVEHRRKLIDEKLKENPRFLDTVKRSYLYSSDLSKRNRMIYDALLKNYKGHHQDVIKHIRVERFRISQRYSTAAVTVEPQIHVDAKIQQITMDKRLAGLPPSLQSLNLFSLTGETVMANRGILEFSDLLKRPLDTYKYLLMTMETKNLNLQGILTELDIFFIGTSNELHLAAFKQHPDFSSFRGRFNFVRVPYLLDVNEEVKIYKRQIEGLRNSSSFEPHALFALCLFAVISRLRSPRPSYYRNKKLGEALAKLTPLEKALLIAKIETPEKLDSEAKQLLKGHFEEFLGEFDSENLYEGKFGPSPRDIKKIIYKLARKNKVVTFVEVIEYLQKLITQKNEYPFLEMAPQADYHNPPRFVSLIKEYCLNIFDKELRDSLGMVDERSYEDYIKKYIENITALIKKEKIKNSITGLFEECDQYFIKEFESNLNLKEKSDHFRSYLLSKLGAYSLDHPGETLTYTLVFPELTKKLKESFYKEQKKMINNVVKNLVFFEANQETQEELSPKKNKKIGPENQAVIQNIIDNLRSKYHYSAAGALSALKYLIMERY